MITEGTRDFNIPDAKPPFSAWPCSIDISRFLDGDTISTMDCSAVSSSGIDATAIVLDDLKHSYTTTSIIPWVKAGAPDTDYIVIVKVTTSSGAKEVFTIRFSVLPAIFKAALVGLDAVLAA